MKEIVFEDISIIANENKSCGSGPEFLSEEQTAPARRVHKALPEYEITPLAKLDSLSQNMRVKAFLVKDESYRFGLKAFKVLGGVYAVTRVICKELGLDINSVTFSDFKSPEMKKKLEKMVFVTATDGNHGRGLAWAAAELGCEAHVYMPVGSSEFRADAIRSEGGCEVTIMDVGYDDAVRHAAKMADKHGWYLIQDTSWEGYEDVPQWIAQGYSTMAEEACNQLDEMGLKPTHVFLQAGVGCMAGGVLGYLANRYEGCRPKAGIVEPENIACIYESAKADDGAPHAASDQKDTIMAGLNCGEPCLTTWPVLRDFADWYIKCPDYISAYGMRLLASPTGEDPKVISGESGAVTAGFAALASGMETTLGHNYEKLREFLGLDENSVVLCFSTEGDTDPDNYRRIVYGGAYPMPM